MNQQAKPAAEWSMTDQEFDQLRRAIYEFSGIVIGPEKRSMIRARLQRRISALQLQSLAEYLKMIGLVANGIERDNFISSLTTNVTSFFREQHHFDLLAERIVPRCDGPPENIHIWSAGCSSGQEPYSIAMHFFDRLPDHVARTHITATDIDHDVLRKAKTGIYSRRELAGIPPAMVSRYFRGTGNATCNDELQLQPNVRKMIEFKQLNLNGRWAMAQRFDVIFCRNVAIYFDPATQLRLWRKFVSVLRPGGWLLVGHAERVPPELHATLQPNGITAYQKTL